MYVTLYLLLGIEGLIVLGFGVSGRLGLLPTTLLMGVIVGCVIGLIRASRKCSKHD